MDRWIVGALIPLAAWILLSGLDDLFIDLVFCWQYLRVRLFLMDGLRWPSTADLDRWPRRRIAIFVPLWQESDVIGSMLEHNLSAIRYDRYDFFLGAYPTTPPLSTPSSRCRHYIRICTWRYARTTVPRPRPTA
jgi:adsorption protein B